MNDQPLPAISSPFALAGQLGFSGHEFVTWLALIVFAFWALYTLVAIYHWIRYSHAALLAIPAILAHLVISGVLILFTWQAVAPL